MTAIHVCQWCAKPMSGRKHKRFCSNSCRYAAWAFDNRYAESEPCYYCGVPADSVDHVPPLSVRLSLAQIDHKFPLEEVPACHECNALLGARPPWTKEDRKHKIKEVLRRKYAKILATGSFTEQELNALGPNLRSSVLAVLILQGVVRQRIDW